ncbi:MAG: hypothetical protein IIA23_06920 [Chloroflexi bacterium]|nr:hypothetical protein [Chloroflexota bacterium]
MAGFLENAIGEVYAEFAHNAGSEPVANFVATRVLRIQNPKAQRFIDRFIRPKVIAAERHSSRKWVFNAEELMERWPALREFEPKLLARPRK